MTIKEEFLSLKARTQNAGKPIVYRLIGGTF